jgi:hypothetical protein
MRSFSVFFSSLAASRSEVVIARNDFARLLPPHAETSCNSLPRVAGGSFGRRWASAPSSASLSFALRSRGQPFHSPPTNASARSASAPL